MAFIFGDGFDSYATVNDAIAGYWDSGNLTSVLLSPGRFSGSQALRNSGANSTVVLAKSSGINDAVHHIVCAYYQPAAITGTNVSFAFQLLDGTTAQCTVGFRSDGALVLTQGAVAGTVLATYAGAVTAQNTWYAFEIEIVIHNTTGSFKVRKNGNTVDDHATININTRGGTANNYANKLSLVAGIAIISQYIDDVLWRSDAASVPWIGDVRCYTRMPLADASTQFVKSAPATLTLSLATNSSTSDLTAVSRYSTFTPTLSGTISTITIGFNAGFTGNCKMALFSDVAGAPGAVLGSATTLVNPVTGTNTFTFPTPVAVPKNAPLWFGISHDVTAAPLVFNSSSGSRATSAISYAAFPVANPTALGGGVNTVGYSIPITNFINADMVNETLQDGTATYVYSSNPTDADFYTMAPIVGTPAAVIAVVTRGFLQKSDAGVRGAAVQIKSGGTTVASTPTLLGTNFGWLYRTDTVDPATGLPWTAAAVNNVQIGPVVSS